MSKQQLRDFLTQMDADMKQANEMHFAELDLADAIKRYERAFKVKLKVTHEQTAT